MIITNFKNLAKNFLRRKALLIAEAGYEAIDVMKTVQRKVERKKGKSDDFLIIQYEEVRPPKIGRGNIRKSNLQKLEINLNDFKRVFLIGIGKGAALASATLVKILGNKLTSGIALDIQYQEVQPPKINGNIRRLNLQKSSSKLKFLIGTHPFPSQKNIIATQKIIKLAKSLKKDELLITFICGGGSALLCGSEKELKNSILATKLLTQAGADIKELNTVRKHLSNIKGGGLAKMAYPATVISLIVSDVAGNNLSMVASGPTVYDKTTKKDAESILKKYSLQPTTYNLRLLETPKGKTYFKSVKNILFLSNREPILAMREKAKKLGFKPKIYSFSLRGEARNVLSPLIKNVPGGERVAVLAGGETIVKFKVPARGEARQRRQSSKFKKLGKGGRNMEAVLGCLSNLTRINLSNKSRIFEKNSRNHIREELENMAIMSFATDGRDNTEAAGAIGDALTLKKAQKLKLNPQEFLDNHDSFNFFAKTRDLIFTKPKTFNVADLIIVLKQ